MENRIESLHMDRATVRLLLSILYRINSYRNNNPAIILSKRDTELVSITDDIKGICIVNPKTNNIVHDIDRFNSEINFSNAMLEEIGRTDVKW